MVEAPEQLPIVLEPNDVLMFRDKLGHIGSVLLVVKNRGTRPLYFKIMSNASKFYGVRPSAGIIQPYGQCKVNIGLNDNTIGQLAVIETNKHRFKVQAAYAEDPAISPDDFWRAVDRKKSMAGIETFKLEAKVERVQPKQQPLQTQNSQQNQQEVARRFLAPKPLPSQFAAFSNSLMCEQPPVGKICNNLSPNTVDRFANGTAKKCLIITSPLETTNNVVASIKKESDECLQQKENEAAVKTDALTKRLAELGFMDANAAVGNAMMSSKKHSAAMPNSGPKSKKKKAEETKKWVEAGEDEEGVTEVITNDVWREEMLREMKQLIVQHANSLITNNVWHEEMLREMEQLKIQNAQMSMENAELKQRVDVLEEKMKTIGRKFKSIALALQ